MDSAMTPAPVDEAFRRDPPPRLPTAFVTATPSWPRALPHATRRAIQLLLLVVGLAGAWSEAAAATPAPIRAEIDALLTRLQASGCSFQRNGTWYGGARAKAHLLRKLEYIERRAALTSTEQFIEHAASSSSSTGKPYQVRCGAAAPVASRTWLTRELAVIRSSGNGRGKP